LITRRQKAERVIMASGGLAAPGVRRAINRTIGRKGLEAFDDAGVELIARNLISEHVGIMRANRSSRQLLARVDASKNGAQTQ
jgi:hypothetical protein